MEKIETEIPKNISTPNQAEYFLNYSNDTSYIKSDTEISWDNFSLTYSEFINKCTLSLMSTLSALSRISTKKMILDAGCGPGLGTKLLTSMMANLDSTIYAFDLSEEMIKLSYKVFNEYDDFNKNESNSWAINTYLDPDNKINIEKDLLSIRPLKNGKVVNFFKGNVENLIFEDEQFDAYISNLCLMICQDPDRAIKEAYRVLKPGGTATVSIWGKREDTKLAFVLFNEVFAKFGYTPPAGSKSSFDLSKDTEELKKKFVEAGFRNVRLEYMNVIFDCFDEEDYMFKFQGPQVKSLCKNIQDLKVKEIMEEVKYRAKEELAKGAIPVLNCLVVHALK